MQYISPNQAAEITGMHPNTITQALRRGELKGHKPGRGKNARWKITETDLQNWIEQTA